jgi:hypothetical protein
MNEKGERKQKSKITKFAILYIHLLYIKCYKTACEATLGGMTEGKRAGDGARTRDSLLGRQVGAVSPLASYKMASQADLALLHPL